MNLRVLENAAAVAIAGADIAAREAAARPRMVLALPTGRTPLPMFDELALPTDDPRAFLKKHAWSRDTECRRYEERLTRAGGLDLAILGLGKATSVKMLATRTDDPHWPCTFLARHGDLTVLLDPEAAALL